MNVTAHRTSASARAVLAVAAATFVATTSPALRQRLRIVETKPAGWDAGGLALLNGSASIVMTRLSPFQR